MSCRRHTVTLSHRACYAAMLQFKGKIDSFVCIVCGKLIIYHFSVFCYSCRLLVAVPMWKGLKFYGATKMVLTSDVGIGNSDSCSSLTF